MKKIICILIALWTCVCASAKTYWCSPDGFSDGSSYDRAGSFTVLVSGLAAGDTLYLRGGQYDFDHQINIGCSGTADRRIVFMACPGEKPVLDLYFVFRMDKFESMTALASDSDEQKVRDASFYIGSYVRRYGFDIDFDPVADVNTNPQNIGQIINSKQSIMIEKKKNYLTPLMKVDKVQNAQIICGSQQNESYIEGSAGSWYD